MIWVPPKAFTGEFPFSQFLTLAAISSKISDGIRPDRPQGAEKLGLTVSLWEMTCRCWHQDPAQRPNITEVAGLLRELSLSPLSMEADLLNFFQVCKTQSRDHRERAQEFANELDEVRHAERHAPTPLTTSPGTRQHRPSPGKTGSISAGLTKAVSCF